MSEDEEKLVNELSKFIDNKYLMSLFYQQKLFKGERLDNVSNYVLPEHLLSLKEQHRITICGSNNQFLSPEDTVKITVELQNISNLSIKTFIINTENYYTKTLKNFDCFLNVEGLIPQHSQEFSFDNIISANNNNTVTTSAVVTSNNNNSP